MTRAEVSLGCLIRNYKMVRERLGVEVCAVVKCDGYGHGAIECARALVQEGAAWLAVSCPTEGVALRNAGITQRILLLSSFYRDEAETVVRYGLTPNIWEDEQVDYLARAVAAVAGDKTQFPVHVEVDTGMSRQGVQAARAPEFLRRIRERQNLEVEGLFQHYAMGERAGEGSPRRQEIGFAGIVDVAREAGFAPSYVHMVNSGAAAARAHVLRDPQFTMKGSRPLARIGIALYGYCLPLENDDSMGANWNGSPVLSWKTGVISLREVPAGTGIGYSGAYTTKKRTRIASLPIGYGDGLNRLLSSRGRVLVRGEYAPIIGNVSMDMTLIDVTDVAGVSIGDEVAVIGEQNERIIDAWEHAKLCGTIPYEVVCGIGPRVPRVYVR